MGGSASKDVVIPVAPEASSDAAARRASEEEEYERRRAAAEATYRDVEEKIFKEARDAAGYFDQAEFALGDGVITVVCWFVQGYRKGAHDAVAQLDDELARQAKVVYAQELLAEESARRSAVDKEAGRVAKEQYRAPFREGVCQAQENAFLAACAGSSAAGSAALARPCADAMRAYASCADAQLHSLMNPIQAKPLA